MLDFALSHIVVQPIESPVITNALVVVWLLVIGGSIGSFLNVVVYRLPAGLSIVKPRSFCPQCKTPILSRDNLPVVGWLLLRGRCRVCRAAISPRYPLVELAAALVLTGLAFGEPLTGGAILPIARASAENYPLFGMSLYHFALLCGLGTAALMNHDDAMVPTVLWKWLLLLGFVPAAVWPMLRPVSLNMTAADSWATGIVDGLLGAAVGAALGVASWPASTIGTRGRSGHLDAAAGAACVGVFLGAQAAVGVVLTTTLLHAVWKIAQCFVGNLRFPWTAVLAAGSLTWLFGWRAIVEIAVIGHVSLFDRQTPWWEYPPAVVVVFVLSLVVRMVANKSSGSAIRPTPAN